MKKPLLRTLLLPIVTGASFSLLDFLADRMSGSPPDIDVPHLVLAALVALVTGIMIGRADHARRRADGLARQIQTELEQRVRERTAELEQANSALELEIAERQRTEQSLRDSEERYRTLFDVFPEPSTVWDRHGVLLMQNLVSARNLGGPHESFLGKTMAEILGPGAGAYLERIAGAIDSGSSELQEDAYALPSGLRYFSTAMQRVQMPGGEYAAQVISYDITERRRAEERIRHLSSFPQLNPNPIVEVDASGSITYLNASAGATLRRLGLEVDGTAFFPEDLDMILRELSLQREMSYLRQVKVGAATFEATVQLIPAFGVARLYAHEITERLLAIDALRVSEDKFATVFRLSPDAISIIGAADGRILDANEAFCSLVKTDRRAVVGQPWRDLAVARAAAQRSVMPERLLERVKIVNHEVDFATPDGAIATVLLSLNQIVIGGQPCVLAIAHDITEGRQAERALRASEEKIDRVLESVQELTSVWRTMRNQQGEIVDWTLIQGNRTFLRTIAAASLDRIYGARAGELFGGAWVEGHLPAVRHAMEEDSVQAFEWQWNGTHYLVSVCPIDDTDFLTTGTDITLVKETEEALRRVQTARNRDLAERAALEERQRLARELHDSVSQALYGISLGVHTALTMLGSDLNKVREALAYALDLATAGLTEMRALIFELRPESLEQEGLVAALAKQAAAIRSRHGIAVSLNVCAEPDLPISVKEALYRIAQEAMQNAIKHAQGNRLELSLVAEASGLTLEVTDNGVGFQPLDTFPGHLGLRSMHERARDAGGTLSIDSEPGSGTRICARIPAPAPQAGQAGQ